MGTRGKIAPATVVVLTILVGTAFALSTISLTLGSLPSYDFGTVNLTTGDIDPVGTKPATVQFQTFTVKPGEAFDWHYHKAVAYVAIEHGTLSERHINEDGTCSAWVASGWDPDSWNSPATYTRWRIRARARRWSHGPQHSRQRTESSQSSRSSASAASILPRTRRIATERVDQLPLCVGDRDGVNVVQTKRAGLKVRPYRYWSA